MICKFIKNGLIIYPVYLGKDVIKFMMRTFIFLFCATLFSLTPKHTLSQNQKIVIDADKLMSVDAVFKIIKRQTDYSFVYHEDLFKDFPKVSLKKGVIRLNKLLNQSLPVGSFNVFFIANNTILIKEKTGNTKAEQCHVSGIVTDEKGLPIPGATVLIKGTNRGASTNLDGNYTITVPDPANVLVFSFLGFEPQEITVGNQTTINISLKEDISELDVVTISGRYYNNSQREETGSVVEIDAKIIEKQPVNNPLAAMQGHLSGVNISQKSGVSGGGFNIEIRGQNLGTRNAPLYIVDGVPYDSGTLEDPTTTLAAFIIPGGEVSPLNTINPSDIKSIQVLKDADATAIYGSRGANGVVIITTKKGREGKTQVKLNVSTTLSEVPSFVDLLNTEQYLEVRREASLNDGGTWPLAQTSQNELTFPDLLLWDQDRYTDWQEVLIGGAAYRQNAQLSFSGGSEQTQFLLSGGYVNETTVFPGDSGYKKTTVRLSVNHRSKDERFNMNTSINYGTDTNNLPATDFTGKARTLAPNAPVLYNDDGSLNWEGGTWENPLAILETTYNAVSNSLIANTVLSYRPVPDLELKTSLGYTDNRFSSYGTIPHTAYDPNIPNFDSSRSLNRTNEGTRNSWVVEPQINWGHSWGNTSIKLLLGSTFQYSTGHQLLLGGKGFSSNELIDNLPSATSNWVSIDDTSEYKYQSVFGRINFNWQDKYILNLTGRRDGSSRFGPGKQYGSFGAIGAAWLFSEENFLKDHTFLSFGKFRVSYGTAGSDNIGDYGFYDSYETFGNYNGSGLAPTRLFNPDYAWTETQKLETALELGFLKDRIFLSMAWYQNRSSNQLINAPLPLITGFSGVTLNWDAVVENTGIEIDLRSVNIQNEGFKWSTTLNISANRNKLVAFPGLEGSAWDGKLEIGKSLSIIPEYNFIGIDPETGVYQFEDYNNDGLLNFQDQYVFEDLAPKYFGGLDNSIQYKDLQLTVFLQFVKQRGRKYSGASSPGQFVRNAPKTVLDRWQQPGDQNPVQRYSVSDNGAWELYRISTAGTIDRSFIRLRNVSLNYTVPKAFTKGLDVSLFLQGQNLLVISRFDGADPEVVAIRTLPPLRQFSLGLNLGF